MREIPDFSSFWATGFDDAFYGKGLVPFCVRKSHKLVEAKFGENDFFEKVVDIGSGVGYHLEHVKHKYGSYTLADTNEKVIKKLNGMEFPKNISICKLEEGPLPFQDNEFDRLVSLHVLEHIHHPEIALSEWSRVVKNNGIISILLPCDPGAPWRFGRYVSSRRRAEKTGMVEYDLFIALEHVNSINNLIAMIRYFFETREEKFWPFNIKTTDINLLYAVHIHNIK
jgi:ubiquinone/menaquinone biosynthesis C-methylase UbiE